MATYSDVDRYVHAIGSTIVNVVPSPTVLAFLTDPDVIYKILKHLELPTASPPLLPNRGAVEEFDQCINIFAADDGHYAEHVSPGHNRCQRPRPARPPPLNRAADMPLT